MAKFKVLITGGAGFIGSHTADALSAQGYKIRILDSLTQPVHKGKWPSYLSKKYELIRGDVTKKQDWLKALKDVDYVFHLAAYQDYLLDFSKFFQVNTFSTALLYELICAKRLPIKKIIYGSSQAVYGEGKYQCQNKIFYSEQRSLAQLKKKQWDFKCLDGKTARFLPMKETDLLRPHNAYGMSKAAAEAIALNLGRRYKIPTTALRYSIVQGARQSPYNAYSGALRIFVSQAAANSNLTVFEDGRQRRDFINIKDVIKANLLVLKSRKTDFQAFNVGSGRAWTVVDFARAVIKVIGPTQSKIKIDNEFRVGDTRNALSDIAKLKKMGWQPKYCPEDSIKEYFFWFKTLPKTKDFSKKAYFTMKKLGVVLK